HKRNSRVGRGLLHLRGAAARSRGGRRGPLAENVEGPYRQSCDVSRRLAQSPAPRFLLEAWFDLPGLERYRMSGLRGRRMARRLYPDGVETGRESQGAVQGLDRPMGSQGAATRRSGSGYRFLAGMCALVGSVPEG